MLCLQMEQLEYVLGRLNAAPEVWQAPVFSKAWRTMLVTPLTKGDRLRLTWTFNGVLSLFLLQFYSIQK